MKREKLRLLAGGMLCLGVLLGGMGAGVAFGEFSGFTYRKIAVKEGQLETENYTCSLDTAEGPFRVLSYTDSAVRSLESDESVPVNTMEVSVVYNSQVCRPDIWTEEGNLIIDIYGTGSESELERLMEWKDGILEGIKERELRDYQVEWVRSVTCRVNPADLEKIIFY